jgi:hypothetical protein
MGRPMLCKFSLVCAAAAALLFPLPAFAGHDRDDHHGGWRGGGWHGDHGRQWGGGGVDFNIYVGPRYPYYGYADYPYYGYYYPYGNYPYYGY